MKRQRGIGKIKTTIVEMLRDQLHINCDPANIWMNNYPTAKSLDAAAWGVTGTKDGYPISICSWDRMTDIVRAKKIVIINNKSTIIEVCAGEEQHERF